MGKVIILNGSRQGRHRITGENICIDGGMTHQMIYHGDNGWKLEIKPLIEPKK